MQLLQVGQLEHGAKIEVVSTELIVLFPNSQVCLVLLSVLPRLFYRQQQLGDVEPLQVVLTEREHVENSLWLCRVRDIKLNQVLQVPLEEHPSPAVAVTRDVTEVPPVLTAAFPVNAVGDQVGCDRQRQGQGQCLLDHVFLAGREFIEYLIFCKKMKQITQFHS